jgi:hypothetical protein
MQIDVFLWHRCNQGYAERLPSVWRGVFLEIVNDSIAAVMRLLWQLTPGVKCTRAVKKSAAKLESESPATKAKCIPSHRSLDFFR